jgi:hypothetical protein
VGASGLPSGLAQARAETKNGEGRNFPLTPTLRAVVEHQRERSEALAKETGRIVPWLFHRGGQPIKNFRRAWLTACRQAGLAGRIPHDFRRTAVRNLERAGVPRSVAMKLVGHKTESVYRRYAIASETDLKDGGVKLERLHRAEPGARVVVGLHEAPGPNSGRVRAEDGMRREAGTLQLRDVPARKWWAGTGLNRRHQDFQT